MQISPQELGAAICEISVFIILLIVGIMLIERYQKRKINNILILAICLLIFSIAPLMQTLDIFYFTDFFAPKEVALGYNLAFSMSAYANILLLLFYLRVYVEESTKVNIIVVIYAIFNILNTILLINTSIQLMINNITIDRTLFMVIHLALSMALYIYMVIQSTKSANKDVTLKVRRGFQLITGFGICLILTFAFFLMDFVWIILFVSPYSIWLYIGWVCGATGAILAYLGYIMPDWLKRRWE
ncbi:MAG: hypothetical protein EAX96_16855 [Candidatus Lokiarchaeota archaeon]|nr:hypothetical protein [Candidatus Lokiarchaeota archaeon]